MTKYGEDWPRHRKPRDAPLPAMIHYQLRCAAQAEPHEFDGWYKDSAAFEKLAAAGMVECPVCGATKVERALMAPSLGKGTRKLAAEPAPPPAPASAPAPAAAPAPVQTAGPMPPQLRALLQRMRAEVERNCDYVGRDFAEEARKMQRGESERRGIYGEASDAEAEALRDEGIDVSRIPWVPPADA